MDEKTQDNLRCYKLKETKLFKNKIRAARERTERKPITILINSVEELATRVQIQQNGKVKF